MATANNVAVAADDEDGGGGSTVWVGGFLIVGVVSLSRENLQENGMIIFWLPFFSGFLI